MTEIFVLLSALNNLSPLAIIGLLSLVIFYQLKGHKQVDAIRSNDLHNLEDMAEALHRLEIMLAEQFTYIKAKLQ